MIKVLLDIIIAVVALAAIIAIAFVLYCAYMIIIRGLKISPVIGPSMEPTLHEKECVLVARTKFYRNVKVGDIVCLNTKKISGCTSNSKYIIKRVSEIDKENNKIYVLGDNRNSSYDSRSFGWVPMEAVKFISLSEKSARYSIEGFSNMILDYKVEMKKMKEGKR